MGNLAKSETKCSFHANCPRSGIFHLKIHWGNYSKISKAIFLGKSPRGCPVRASKLVRHLPLVLLDVPSRRPRSSRTPASVSAVKTSEKEKFRAFAQ